MSELLRQECCVVAYILSLKHFMKAGLCQQRGHMMNESKWICLPSRFSAVTWMDCVDHSFRSASDSLMFRTTEAALCRCFVVGESVRKDLSHLSLSQRLLLMCALVHPGVVPAPHSGWWQALGADLSEEPDTVHLTCPCAGR